MFRPLAVLRALGWFLVVLAATMLVPVLWGLARGTGGWLPLVQGAVLTAAAGLVLAAVDRILQFVRRGRVLSVTTFRDEEAEAIELLAGPESRYVGKPMRDANFPKDSVVGALVRPSGEVIVPRGNTVVRAGDRLIVFALERVVPTLEAAVAGRPEKGR
jgi:trk system potassium uptake protein TrkA